MTKTVFLENQLKSAFLAALECGMTKENANMHTKEYNALYLAGLAFLEKSVLLCKNCALKLHCINCSIENAALECAEHIFWNRLDYILCANEETVVPLIVTMAKRKVCDIFESEIAMYQKIEDMDEYGWSIISDENDIETAFTNRESALFAVKALCDNKNKLEAVSFLATKLMGIKAGTFSKLLNGANREKVIEYVLSESAKMLSLDKNYFNTAKFIEGAIKISDTKEISRASDRAKNKIKNFAF